MNWRQIVKSLVRLGAVVGTTLPAGFAGRTVAALRDQQSKDRGAAPSPGSGSAASVVSTDTAAGKAGRAGEGEAPGL